MSAELRPTPEPSSELFHELYEQFGAELLQARAYISAECADPEMRKQFDNLEAEALYLLIRSAEPETLVEISPNDGWSTTWILKAMADNQKGNLQSYDVHDRAKNFVPSALTDRWQLNTGDVRDHEVKIPDEIDFLLLDSKHTYGFAKWYFKEIIPRVKDGAPIVIHDIESGLSIMPGVLKIWSGLNLPGTEAWKVQREFRQRRLGYFTLCRTTKLKASGVANRTKVNETRHTLGFEQLSENERNPAIFFFQSQ